VYHNGPPTPVTPRSPGTHAQSVLAKRSLQYKYVTNYPPRPWYCLASTPASDAIVVVHVLTLYHGTDNHAHILRFPSKTEKNGAFWFEFRAVSAVVELATECSRPTLRAGSQTARPTHNDDDKRRRQMTTTKGQARNRVRDRCDQQLPTQLNHTTPHTHTRAHTASHGWERTSASCPVGTPDMGDTSPPGTLALAPRDVS
jgi:hypothetical protein